MTHARPSLWRGALLALSALPAIGAAPPTERYVTGQIWLYHNLPQDAGSRIKIQRVSALLGKPEFHIAISGVMLGGKPGNVVWHLPVSTETLDASVIELSTGDFPVTLSQTDEGIAEWDRAQGGVYTISIEEIIGLVEKMITGGSEPPPP